MIGVSGEIVSLLKSSRKVKQSTQLERDMIWRTQYPECTLTATQAAG
jgi:hypothetical protein